MSTYIIGDVQGCFDSLQALLHRIQFNPQQDRLGFVGDLVNRGPKSLETLRFIMQLKDPLIVLGNHDLHLLALYFYPSFQQHNMSHTLNDILTAADCGEIIHFLLQQPFLRCESTYALVHAGIPPQWSMEVALNCANAVETSMRTNPAEFFQHMYGNFPSQWHNDLKGWDRIRYSVNALTRMRFCTKNGELDLENSTPVSTNSEYQPWFAWQQTPLSHEIYFGHWASLNGKCDHSQIFALDTGCAWGGELTAVRTEDHQKTHISSQEPGILNEIEQ